MLNDADPTFAPSEDLDTADGLALLVAGITAYLQEIDGCRAICWWHEGTATVTEDERGCRVTRCFAYASETVSHLKTAVGRLPRGRGREGSGRGDNKGRGVEQREGSHAHVRREVTWEGNRVLIHGYTHSRAVLNVDVLLFSGGSDQPKLPLQTLASILRCHEFLVHESIANALPVPSGDTRTERGVRDYLLRTMPQKLCASQCI